MQFIHCYRHHAVAWQSKTIQSLEPIQGLRSYICRLTFVQSEQICRADQKLKPRIQKILILVVSVSISCRSKHRWKGNWKNSNFFLRLKIFFLLDLAPKIPAIKNVILHYFAFFVFLLFLFSICFEKLQNSGRHMLDILLKEGGEVGVGWEVKLRPGSSSDFD